MTRTDDLFPELATTLFYFIEALHERLLEEDICQVYFLSREGQPLKRMFDMYERTATRPIESHYLEVSRRSTLLPSLSQLDRESFETLFRQYRRISLIEFLASLGLEAYGDHISQALGLSGESRSRRYDDFPDSDVFEALKQLPLFRDVYEAERMTRRNAFIAYLTRISGGKIPTRLVIVDVGWKGTIQDHLFSMLCGTGATEVEKITGYYLGLVGAGVEDVRNEKRGLLFSIVGERTPKWRIFNENRALFEVVLAADHGSITGYEMAEDGQPQAVRGDFDERKMLETAVFPVLEQVCFRFSQLVEMHRDKDAEKIKFTQVVREHARMVFNPTISERRWFSSVFHVENYGVFELSRFSEEKESSSCFDRIRFILKVLKREPALLGFWPWKTLYEQGGPAIAKLYAAIRCLQR